MNYSFLVVSSYDDFLIVQTSVQDKFCQKCLEKKKDCTILKSFSLDISEVKELNKKFNIQVVRVKCEC